MNKKDNFLVILLHALKEEKTNLKQIKEPFKEVE